MSYDSDCRFIGDSCGVEGATDSLKCKRQNIWFQGYKSQRKNYYWRKRKLYRIKSVQFPMKEFAHSQVPNAWSERWKVSSIKLFLDNQKAKQRLWQIENYDIGKNQTSAFNKKKGSVNIPAFGGDTWRLPSRRKRNKRNRYSLTRTENWVLNHLTV